MLTRPVQVINGIQTGAYKNIYNPENFYVHKEGTGAGNNWAAGYSMGEQVHEEVMDMIDREADGSDSLEVCGQLSKKSRPYPLTGSRLSCCFIPLRVEQDQVLGAFSSSVSTIDSPRNSSTRIPYFPTLKEVML